MKKLYITTLALLCSLIIYGQNTAPEANNDFNFTLENDNVVTDVQANDSDPDGDPLTTNIITQPQNGLATVINSDSIFFDPDVNFSGKDTIIYEICDNLSACDTAMLIITVQEINNAPIAINDGASTSTNQSVMINVQSNDSDNDGDPLTTTIFSMPDNGTAIIINSDSIQYTPNNGFSGSDTLIYEVCDPAGGCDQASVVITISPNNQAPVAMNDLAELPENDTIYIDVQENDTDPDGDPMTTTIVNAPNHGTAMVTNGDSILYWPAAGYFGKDTLIYSVCDPAGACENAYVAISVTFVNHGAAAHNDTVTMSENTSIYINVQANDYDPDESALTTNTLVATPNNGTATVINADSIQYTPNNGFTGTDQFIYELCDITGVCNNASVTVYVTPFNSAPNAQNDFATIPENTDTTMNVQGNDSDPDGDPLTTSIIAGPYHGIALVINDSIYYEPAAGYFGKDTITYEVCDGNGLCDIAEVVMTVSFVNHGAAAHNDTITIIENTSIVIDVQANDYDPDATATTTNVLVSNPTNGTAIILNGDSIQYTPNPGFVGTDQCVYELCDPFGVCNNAQVTVYILPDNHVPDANPDFVQMPENTDTTIHVQSNDSDPDGDPLTTSIVSGPSNGIAIVTNDSIFYEPAPGFVGEDTLWYSVCDPSGLCDTTEMIVTVTLVNAGAAAHNDTATTLENTTVVVDVQANDYDPDATAITTNPLVSNPSNGTATVINGDSIQYTPNPGFTGTDQFTYELCDPFGVCNNAIVTIHVLPSNNTPNANDDFVQMNENTDTTVYVQVNDSDPDGDPLTTSIISGPSHGIAVVTNDSIFYEPDEGYFGEDTLMYQVCDGTGLCDNAQVIFTVIMVNHSAAAHNDTVTVPANTTSNIYVQDNDYDPDATIILTNIVSGPSNGVATVVDDTVVSYTPNPGYTGPDQLMYEVCDPFGWCDQATVYITVVPTTNAPVAENDFAQLPENTSITLDVQVNDSDPDGDPLTTSIISSPVNGIAVVTNDSIYYEPAAGYYGQDTLTYEVCDGGGLCDQAQVFYTVTFVNHPPAAENDTVSTLENTSVTIDVQDNDYDPDLTAMNTSIINMPDNGTVSVLNNDSVMYTPNTGYTGMDVFTYEICDPFGDCDQASVFVNVTPDNFDPIAVQDFAFTSLLNSVTVDVQANDTDPEGDPLTTSIVIMPSKGSASVMNGDSIMYNPFGLYAGKDTLVYEVCDPFGNCDQTWLIVTISEQNVSPLAFDDIVWVYGDSSAHFDVQANDIDPEAGVLLTSMLNQAVNGLGTIVDDDSIHFTPNLGYLGFDKMTYQICDNGGLCDYADVRLEVIEFTGVNDIDLGTYIEIYPNPNNGQFMIDFDLDRSRNIQLDIYNAVGELISSKNLNNIQKNTERVDISNQATGYYIISIKTEDSIYTRKISVR